MSSATRVSTARMLELGAGLSEPERSLIRDLDQLRLASHSQLGRLLGAGSVDATATPTDRTIRRLLARLTADGVLARLERRIGGLRAGSAGYVYYLGPVGQRLISYWDGDGLTRGRVRPEPGGRYVRHRLAVSDIAVQAREAVAAGTVEVLALEPEPECWRPLLDASGGQTILKPDLYLRLGVGAYEDRVFLEIDLGTESRPVVSAKLRAYIEYFLSGAEQSAHGVFPRVAVLTNTDARRAALVDVCARLPAEYWALFTVLRIDDGLQALLDQIADDAHADDPGGQT